MKIVGLFAGIGGLELGLERAGHELKAVAEIDPHAQAVLAHRFPNVRMRVMSVRLDRLMRLR